MNKRAYLLEDLLDGTLWGPSNQVISSVVYDSREIEEADAFVCISGEKQDGHRFIDQAIRDGAKTIIGTDHKKLKSYAKDFPEVSFVGVSDSNLALAQLSSVVYGNPSESLLTIGVTGTNGKTTVSTFIYSLLNKLSLRTGCIGTAGIWDDKRKTTFKQTVPTTPEAPDIQRVLNYFRENEMKAAVIESTSIAIEQKRLEAIDFDIAVHTNLTPEHLEFHGTMEAYKEAKLKLFDKSQCAIVNVDDPGMSGDLLERFQGQILTYGLHESADIRARNIRSGRDGTAFTLTVSNRKYSVN
ncbi:MAG: Mur ligase family protein, partial [Anaerobacillus sp.]